VRIPGRREGTGPGEAEVSADRPSFCWHRRNDRHDADSAVGQRRNVAGGPDAPVAGGDAMTAPLHGLRVVDLTMVWAGPFGTRMLGDYGAEVIKVESPRQWDLLRGLGLIPRDVPRWYNRSGYFNHNNRDKYGFALDLANETGREVLLKLCEVSDVIVENYR